jgi:hypothetical protein
VQSRDRPSCRRPHTPRLLREFERRGAALVVSTDAAWCTPPSPQRSASASRCSPAGRRTGRRLSGWTAGHAFRERGVPAAAFIHRAFFGARWEADPTASTP